MTRREDAKTTGAALIFIGVMVALALVGGAVGVAMTEGVAHFDRHSPVTPVQAAVQRPPGPRLQVDPLADRAVMAGPDRLAAQGGPSHLPVDEAMRRLAAEGWPQAETELTP